MRLLKTYDASYIVMIRRIWLRLDGLVQMKRDGFRFLFFLDYFSLNPFNQAHHIGKKNTSNDGGQTTQKNIYMSFDSCYLISSDLYLLISRVTDKFIQKKTSLNNAP